MLIISLKYLFDWSVLTKVISLLRVGPDKIQPTFVFYATTNAMQFMSYSSNDGYVFAPSITSILLGM